MIVQLGLGDGGLLCEGAGLTEGNLFNYIMGDDFENILVWPSSSSSSSSAFLEFVIRFRFAKTSCSSCSLCTSTVIPLMVSFGGRSATDPPMWWVEKRKNDRTNLEDCLCQDICLASYYRMWRWYIPSTTSRGFSSQTETWSCEGFSPWLPDTIR